MTSRYVAIITGQKIQDAYRIETTTITAAREAAEGYGNHADACEIQTRAGHIVGRHMRNRSNGEWFRAQI